MSIIEEGKELIRRVENNILTRELVFTNNIGELINELEKQQAVIDVIKEQLQDSYYGHEGVNLTPSGRATIEEALASLEKDND